MTSLSEMMKKSKEANQQQESKQVAAASAGAGSKLKLNLGPKSQSQSSGAPVQPEVESQSAVALKSSETQVTPAGNASAPQTPPADASADFLAGVDLNDIPENRSGNGQTETPPAEIFQDQIPVEKPERELPESITEQQQAFVTLLDSVYELHHDVDAIKNAVQRLMIDMRETPHLADLVEDADVTIIIRRMSQILGFRKASAQTAKAKRSTSKKAKMAESLGSELDALMGDLKL